MHYNLDEAGSYGAPGSVWTFQRGHVPLNGEIISAPLFSPLSPVNGTVGCLEKIHSLLER